MILYKHKLLVYKFRIKGIQMSIKNYITTQLIHIIHFNEITQYTNMIAVEVLPYRTISSRINEKVLKSHKFKH